MDITQNLHAVNQSSGNIFLNKGFQNLHDKNKALLVRRRTITISVFALDFRKAMAQTVLENYFFLVVNTCGINTDEPSVTVIPDQENRKRKYRDVDVEDAVSIKFPQLAQQ